MTASRPCAEVIGDPVDHSLSPVIHGFWLEVMGIEAEYRRRRVGRGELAAYVEQRRSDGDWRGCNVTMPLKLDAITLADEASDRAVGTGAANILIPRNGKILAGNSDVAAVMILAERLRHSGARFDLIHLLGSGGAARAALMALHLLGQHQVQILSRDRAEAIKLAVQFGLQQEPQPFDTPLSGDGLINATPLGMAGSPPLHVELSSLKSSAWVIDFVTVPSPTPLIQQAARLGLATVDGIAMLVEQAADSFRHFFDAEPPRDRDSELMERLGR